MLIEILSCLLAVIYPILIMVDIHEQRKTQKKVDGLLKDLNTHNKSCNEINHKLSEIVNDQSTFNEAVTHNMENQWLAIHIIVNQIKERE